MAPGAMGDRSHERRRMVGQLASRGIVDERVLAAFTEIPREAFVPPGSAADAYEDGPLPIGHGQTISQPFVVALMVQELAVAAADVALEVGAGSGYAAAVLSRLARRVVAVERHRELAEAAAERLANGGFANVEVHHGDGTGGWPPSAPFDVILVSAASDHVPPELIEQLAVGGRLVMPVGRRWGGGQHLVRLTKAADGQLEERRLGPVAFVPLIGGG